jgi:hypothetical protein
MYDIDDKLAHMRTIIKTEGGIGRPGWSEASVGKRDHGAEVYICFYHTDSVVGSDVDARSVWVLSGELLDRYTRAHLEICRIRAESMGL